MKIKLNKSQEAIYDAMKSGKKVYLMSRARLNGYASMMEMYRILFTEQPVV